MARTPQLKVVADPSQPAADVISQIRAKMEAKYADSTELFPDFTTIRQIATIPSPSAIINVITGIGGLPRGRVVEVYGPFSSGKTTLAVEFGVEAQKEHGNTGVVLYMDYEHAFDATYARKLGLDLHPERFIFAQPTTFEQGAHIMLEYVAAGVVDMVVIDSAAAMTPRKELEGDFDLGDKGTQKGLQAQLMAQFLDRVTKRLNLGRKPTLVVINQTRANIEIGGRPGAKAPPKEKPAGGNALKFYTTMRLELEIVYSEGEENRGTKGTDQIYTQNRVRVTCVKNKLAPPFVRGTLVIEYGKGINNLLSIAELAEARLGIMSGAGFFKYEGDTPETKVSCRGRDQFQALLSGNPELQREIEAKVIESIRAEHAASLGMDNIKTSGKAKEMEPGTLVLGDDEPDENPGPGLPISDEDLD
jgi:recombination protein RecA